MPKPTPEGAKSNETRSTTITPPPNKYGRGYVCDSTEGRNAEFEPIQKLIGGFVRVARTSPAALLQAAHTEGVNNQAGSGSCVGQANSKGANVFYRFIGKPLKKFSAKGSYDLGRMFGKQRAEEKLLDVGSQPHLNVRGMRRVGIPFEETWPSFDPKTGVYLMDKVNVEPPLDVLIAASEFEVTGAHIIVTDDVEKVRDLQVALNVAPVSMAIPAGDLFDSCKGTVEKWDENIKASNHMVLCVGYETIGDTVWFIFMNSWSEEWGDRGFFVVPANLIKDVRVDSLTVLSVSAKSAPVEVS